MTALGQKATTAGDWTRSALPLGTDITCDWLAENAIPGFSGAMIDRSHPPGKSPLRAYISFECDADLAMRCGRAGVIHRPG